MRLQTKVLALVLMLAVPFGAAFFALLFHLLVQQFRSLEEELARQAVVRAQQWMETELGDLQRYANLFVARTPPLETNLSPADVHGMGLSLIIVLDRAGRTQQIVAIDEAGTAIDPNHLMPANASGYYFSFDADRPIRGVCVTPSGPVQYVSIARIRPGDGDGRANGAGGGDELAGSLVFARRFDDRGAMGDAGKLAEQIDVVTAAEAHDSGMPALSADALPLEPEVWLETNGVIAAGLPIIDASGRQTVVLRVRRSRQLYHNAIAGTLLAVAALTIGGLLLTMSFVGALRYMVLRRISRLARFASRERGPAGLLRRIHDDSPDEIGQLVRAFNAMLDRVDDQTELLRHRNRELFGALQVKDEFLHNTSHELRTPLTTIKGFVERLRRESAETHAGPEAAPQAASDAGSNGAMLGTAIREIERASDHLLNLINELLDLARANAGKLEFRLGPVDVLDVLDDVVPLVAVQAEAKGLRIAVVAPEFEVPAVRADHRRLCQVLVNLLANAVKFSERGTIEIGVSVPADQHIARISIRDNGPGIPAEHVARIFEPFTQLSGPSHSSASASGFGTGSGLGLAIAREFVNRMAGQIEVESTAGEGATFTVTLPLFQSWEAGHRPAPDR